MSADLTQLRNAAIALGYAEPISIEPDGTIWLGTDADRTYLTAAQQKAVANKAAQITDAEAAVAASGRAKLVALGLTDAEIAAFLGA